MDTDRWRGQHGASIHYQNREGNTMKTPGGNSRQSFSPPPTWRLAESFRIRQPARGGISTGKPIRQRGESYVITLVPTKGWHTSGIQRLRILLKIALRSFGLRCTSVKAV